MSMEFNFLTIIFRPVGRGIELQEGAVLLFRDFSFYNRVVAGFAVHFIFAEK